jgi:hypothetical protein
VRRVLKRARAVRAVQHDNRASRLAELGAEIERMVAAVADLVRRLADTHRTSVEHLDRVAPRYVDRANTTLKGPIGEIRLVPEGGALMAEFELEGGRLLAAANAKVW